jgi:hypothetical protein
VAAGEEGEKSREWWEDSQLRERGKREKGKRKMRAPCCVVILNIGKIDSSWKLNMIKYYTCIEMFGQETVPMDFRNFFL